MTTFACNSLLIISRYGNNREEISTILIWQQQPSGTGHKVRMNYVHYFQSFDWQTRYSGGTNKAGTNPIGLMSRNYEPRLNLGTKKNTGTTETNNIRVSACNYVQYNHNFDVRHVGTRGSIYKVMLFQIKKTNRIV